VQTAHPHEELGRIDCQCSCGLQHKHSLQLQPVEQQHCGSGAHSSAKLSVGCSYPYPTAGRHCGACKCNTPPSQAFQRQSPDTTLRCRSQQLCLLKNIRGRQCQHTPLGETSAVLVLTLPCNPWHACGHHAQQPLALQHVVDHTVHEHVLCLALLNGVQGAPVLQVRPWGVRVIAKGRSTGRQPGWYLTIVCKKYMESIALWNYRLVQMRRSAVTAVFGSAPCACLSACQ